MTTYRVKVAWEGDQEWPLAYNYKKSSTLERARAWLADEVLHTNNAFMRLRDPFRDMVLEARLQAAMPGERITVYRVDHWIEEVP